MTILQLATGLGIFLFGMVQLERSLEALGSRWIKQWLARSTGNPVSSVFAGTLITAFVQSSSMVSLVVLAFASAGIIPLFNAIGVLLGANLGTTFTGWIVATLGFKLKLSAVAVPAIGLGCLIMVFGERRAKLNANGQLLFGFGLLLFGLDLMKTAVAELPSGLDFQIIKDWSAISFLLLGVVLTAIIQSSSASMLIALTALNASLVDLPDAAALVIGADLGTTSTTALGALKGSVIKKQLALAHFIFNLLVDILAFVLLLPLLPGLLSLLGMTDPLYSLVAFHSSFNVLGLLLFVPVLKPYSSWISRRFLQGDEQSSLDDVPTDVPEAAVKACRRHVKQIVVSALSINMRNLRIDPQQLHLDECANKLLGSATPTGHSFERRYESLKQMEGELLRYIARLQQQNLTAEQSDSIARLLNTARDSVYFVKTLKDIRPNLAELRMAILPELQKLASDYQQELRPFYQTLLQLISDAHEPAYLREQLQQLDALNEQVHQRLHDDIQGYSSRGGFEPEQLSTLFNVNREIWHSGQNILQAARAWFGVEG